MQQRRWGWEDPHDAELWGTHAAFASMYSSFMSGEERVKATLQVCILPQHCIAVGATAVPG